MRLTASKLELYDKPGKGKAANAISMTVTAAANRVFRTIGKLYNRDRVAQEIAAELQQSVYPVQAAYRDYGACDSEPTRVIVSCLCRKVAKRYNLDEFEDNDLYYSLT